MSFIDASWATWIRIGWLAAATTASAWTRTISRPLQPRHSPLRPQRRVPGLQGPRDGPRPGRGGGRRRQPADPDPGGPGSVDEGHGHALRGDVREAALDRKSVV